MPVATEEKWALFFAFGAGVTGIVVALWLAGPFWALVLGVVLLLPLVMIVLREGLETEAGVWGDGRWP